MLLSGLVFPGIGHMVLEQYRRGSILMLIALTAMSAIIKIAFDQAQTIVDRIASGEIPLDSIQVSELIASSSAASDGVVSKIPVIVFVVCWLVGVIDSYRAGAARKNSVCD